MDFFQRCYIFFHLLANKHTLVEYLKVFSSINLYSNRFIVVKITFLLHNKQQEITSVKSFVILSYRNNFLMLTFFNQLLHGFCVSSEHSTHTNKFNYIETFDNLWTFICLYLYQYLAVMMLF